MGSPELDLPYKLQNICKKIYKMETWRHFFELIDIPCPSRKTLNHMLVHSNITSIDKGYYNSAFSHFQFYERQRDSDKLFLPKHLSNDWCYCTNQLRHESTLHLEEEIKTENEIIIDVIIVTVKNIKRLHCRQEIETTINSLNEISNSNNLLNVRISVCELKKSGYYTFSPFIGIRELESFSFTKQQLTQNNFEKLKFKNNSIKCIIDTRVNIIKEKLIIFPFLNLKGGNIVKLTEERQRVNKNNSIFAILNCFDKEILNDLYPIVYSLLSIESNKTHIISKINEWLKYNNATIQCNNSNNCCQIFISNQNSSQNCSPQLKIGDVIWCKPIINLEETNKKYIHRLHFASIGQIKKENGSIIGFDSQYMYPPRLNNECFTKMDKFYLSIVCFNKSLKYNNLNQFFTQTQNKFVISDLNDKNGEIIINAYKESFDFELINKLFAKTLQNYKKRLSIRYCEYRSHYYSIEAANSRNAMNTIKDKNKQIPNPTQFINYLLNIRH
jgi:hypothetical protein